MVVGGGDDSMFCFLMYVINHLPRLRFFLFFHIADPYPDCQTNNSIYNSLDHSQSGHLTYPGSSSSQWESSEPSQQQEYRNHPEDTWCTPNTRLDTSDFANQIQTSSHGKLLLQHNDRKKAVTIDRTMTSSLSAEKREGSFQRPLIRDLRQGKVHGLDGVGSNVF